MHGAHEDPYALEAFTNYNRAMLQAGRYENGRLVAMGECDFPPWAENNLPYGPGNHGNVFTFFRNGTASGTLNLTSCRAPRPTR